MKKNGDVSILLDDGKKHKDQECKKKDTQLDWSVLDTNLSPGDVVAAVENGPINLDASTTIGGATISTGLHTTDTNLNEGEVEAFVTNGIGTISGDVGVIGSITAGQTLLVGTSISAGTEGGEITLAHGTSDPSDTWHIDRVGIGDASRLRVFRPGNEILSVLASTVTSPVNKLDVNGVIRGQSLAGVGGVLIVGDDSTIVDVNAANTMGLYGNQNPALGNLRLGSNGPTIYGKDGNLGIGESNPVYGLDINGVIRGQSGTGVGDVLIVGDDSKIVDVNAANTMGLYGNQNPALGNLRLGTSGSTIYGKYGNLGIGASDPQATLDIAGNVAINGSPVIDAAGKWVGDPSGLIGPRRDQRHQWDQRNEFLGGWRRNRHYNRQCGH